MTEKWIPAHVIRVDSCHSWFASFSSLTANDTDATDVDLPYYDGSISYYSALIHVLERLQ
jgi:hypothetical protein